MERKVISQKSSLMVFFPLSLVTCLIMSGTRPNYKPPVFTETVEKASLDSAREKNSLTLRKVEDKIKQYELNCKHK